jgi:hypothetical protein
MIYVVDDGEHKIIVKEASVPYVEVLSWLSPGKSTKYTSRFNEYSLCSSHDSNQATLDSLLSQFKF